MKTLSRITALSCALYIIPTISLLAQDPRTPISSLPYTVSAQGSYYLTANLIASGGGAGITISADNVTLDLDGFALVGGGSGSVAGINVPAARKNILIRNGTVRGWTNGGVCASNAINSVIQGLRVSNNSAPSSSTNAAGLTIGSGSTVKDCVVDGNSNCDGISVRNACLVSGCVARDNFFGGKAGIRVADNCYVMNNISDSNGAGIATGSHNRIDGNSCTSNGNEGFIIPSGTANNLVIRNSARGNNPNYNIASGNRYGRIADLTAGGTAGVFGDAGGSTVAAAATDPWSNFAY